MAGLLSPLVYAIVDRAAAGSDAAFLGKLAAVVAAAPADGRVWVQLRAKSVPPIARRALLAEAAVLVRRHTDLPVLVNGATEEALQAGFRGVHWPRASLPAAGAPRPAALAWASAAVHDADSLRAAHAAGADVAAFAPVFDPRSKPGTGRGLDALRRICAGSPLPVLALGGVTADNAASCRLAGASGVAVLSPVSQPGADPAATLRALLEVVGSWRPRAERESS